MKTIYLTSYLKNTIRGDWRKDCIHKPLDEEYIDEIVARLERLDKIKEVLSERNNNILS